MRELTRGEKTAIVAGGTGGILLFLLWPRGGAQPVPPSGAGGGGGGIGPIVTPPGGGEPAPVPVPIGVMPSPGKGGGGASLPPIMPGGGGTGTGASGGSSMPSYCPIVPCSTQPASAPSQQQPVCPPAVAPVPIYEQFTYQGPLQNSGNWTTSMGEPYAATGEVMSQGGVSFTKVAFTIDTNTAWMASSDLTSIRGAYAAAGCS